MQNDIIKNPVDFSILIPAYNEENNIIATLKETSGVLEAFNPSYEIIVIDDGSQDRTSEIVRDFISSGNKKVKLQGYFANKGKGHALKYGTNFANGNSILFLDADLDLHPSHLEGMYNIMLQNKADVVIGSKMHKNSTINYPFFRKVLSSSYFLIIKALFRLKVRDTQTGIKLFRQDVLKNCIHKVLVKRYAFDLELLVIINSRGYKICEAPVHVSEHREFRRIGIGDAFKMLFDTLGVFGRFYFKKQYN